MVETAISEVLADPRLVLAEAVRLLREISSRATPGPWRSQLLPQVGEWGERERVVSAPLRSGIKGYQEVVRGYSAEVHGTESGPWLTEEDARWIALVSPTIARPLADWLDEYRRGVERLASVLVPGTVAFNDLVPWTESAVRAEIEKVAALPLALARSIVEADHLSSGG